MEQILNLDNEMKNISYLIHNPHFSNTYKQEYFQHSKTKAIFQAIEKIVKRNITLDLDTLLAYTKVFNPSVDYENIANITEIDWKINIEVSKEILLEDYAKNVVAKTLLEDIAVKSTSKGRVSIKELKLLAESLLLSLGKVGNTLEFLTMKDLITLHKQVLKERALGIKHHTFGFQQVDSIFTRPAAPKEITVLVAMKGGLKSLFTQTMYMNLIRKKVCTVVFNLEMSTESTTDRLLVIKDNIDLRKLQAQKLDEIDAKEINESLESLVMYDDYFALCPEADLSFAQIDEFLYHAKDEFRKRGTLPHDEYMFVVIDLLSMVEDFGDEDPKTIRKAMKTLHRLVRKHNCHVFGLLQANENKLRRKDFEELEQIDNYKIGKEDIEGGAGYLARARNGITITRPKQMKRDMLPSKSEEFEDDLDMVNISIIKQSDGKNGFLQMVLDDNLQLRSFKE